MFAHTGVLHSRFQLHVRRGKECKSRSAHEVVGKIKWKQPVNESNEREVEICCFCQPERRLPSGNKKVLDSYRDMGCHPFWHIRRSNALGTFTSAVVGLEIKVITSSGMSELQTADNTPPKALWDYVVTVPCIVNTQKIACGEEVVLKWQELPGKSTQPKPAPKKRAINAFTSRTEKQLEHVIPKRLIRRYRRGHHLIARSYKGIRIPRGTHKLPPRRPCGWGSNNSKKRKENYG